MLEITRKAPKLASEQEKHILCQSLGCGVKIRSWKITSSLIESSSFTKILPPVLLANFETDSLTLALEVGIFGCFFILATIPSRGSIVSCSDCKRHFSAESSSCCSIKLMQRPSSERTISSLLSRFRAESKLKNQNCNQNSDVS